MHFLLSNDDGFQAPGIRAMAVALKEIGQVSIVAPDRDRSGASNSLTLDRPLRAVQYDDDAYYVNGTPTDCVHLAITGLLDSTPDMVISGINAGANLGDDVHYSGTVAAAMEGRFLGYSSIAVSLAGEQPQHYETAVRITTQLVHDITNKALPENMLLNINVPDCDYQELQGLEITRLGSRHKSEPAIEIHDPKGRKVFWVGPVGPEQDADEGTDFNAIRHKRASITPIKTDMTAHDSLLGLDSWMKNEG